MGFSKVEVKRNVFDIKTIEKSTLNKEIKKIQILNNKFKQYEIEQQHMLTDIKGFKLVTAEYNGALFEQKPDFIFISCEENAIRIRLNALASCVRYTSIDDYNFEVLCTFPGAKLKSLRMIITYIIEKKVIEIQREEYNINHGVAKLMHKKPIQISIS